MMRISKRTLIIVGAVYLIALVATIPANLFTGLINRNLAAVTVAGLEGSIWNGRISQLSVRQVRLQDVHWHLQPWALFLGRLQLRLEYADAQNQIAVSVARGFTGANHVRGLEGRLSVPYVQGLTPYTIPVFKGVVLFEDVSLRLAGRLPDDASGRIQWRGAAVDIGQTVDLGQLQVELEGLDSGIAAIITETSGLLEGEARATLDEQGNYQVDANLKPTDKGAGLSRHLALVMRRTGDGSFRYSTRGRLPLR